VGRSKRKGEAVQKSSLTSRSMVLALVGALLLLPTLASSYHAGIGGPQSHQGSTGQVDIDDVAKSGCLCHNEVADNSVQVILDDVPYAWVAGEIYTFHLQLIGGPEATGTYTAGFSMRVALGTLASDEAQNWEIDGAVDEQTLTHTEASAANQDRMWVVEWSAPEEGSGTVNFWIVGNSVNGDQIPGIPQNQFKLLTNYRITDRIGVGLDVISNSDQQLRGDESNQLDTVAGYTLVNLRASYQFSEQFEVFTTVNNLFDEQFETFGLLGEEPGELEVPIIEDLTVPLFLGPAPPRATFVGLRYTF